MADPAEDAAVLARVRATPPLGGLTGHGGVVMRLGKALAQGSLEAVEVYREAFQRVYVSLGGDVEEAAELVAVVERALRAEMEGRRG